MPEERTLEQLARKADTLGAELDKRIKTATQLEEYVDNSHPLGKALSDAAQRNGGAFRMLTALSREPWAAGIVAPVVEKLEIREIAWASKDSTQALNTILRRNYFHHELSLAVDSAATTGRAFAIVWDENRDGKAEITIEGPTTCIVEYEDGSRHRRKCAMRRWVEGDDTYCTLFYPDAIYKLRRDTSPSAVQWQPVEGKWIIDNPLDSVPMVEAALNRRIRDKARFGHAAGDFQHVLPLIDRVQWVMFAGLCGLTWSGFKSLVLMGERVKYAKDPDNPDQDLVDADGKRQPLAPFALEPGVIAMLESKDSKIQEIAPADLTGYLKFSADGIGKIAALTATQVYRMVTADLINVGPEALAMIGDAHTQKLQRHALSLEPWIAEVSRLALAVEGHPDAAYDTPTVGWADRELTSVAARADAISKWKDVFPWQVIAAELLGWTPEQIDRHATTIAAADLLNTLADPQPQTTPPAA